MLTFLKELPDRYLLVIGFFSVMGFYALFQSDAILQLMINFAVAIIALSQKKQEPVTQNKAVTDSGDINVADLKDDKGEK